MSIEQWLRVCSPQVLTMHKHCVWRAHHAEVHIMPRLHVMHKLLCRTLKFAKLDQACHDTLHHANSNPK